MVLHSGRRARIDDTGGGPAQPAPIAGPPDSRSVVGDPIVMDGRVWGLVMVTMNRPGTSAGDAEQRIAGFTELVATAVSNVQRRTDLIASRRRIVAAGDQMRRRIERNLHDGAQQQLVSLTLQLRGARDGIPDGLAQARAELAQVEEGLANVLNEVREISRGLHPAILSEAGLGPAVKSLARRASLPVNLDLRVAERLSEPVEVAAYYMISEALANAVKYASASAAEVEVRIDNEALCVHVRDNGTGGADPARGSGIVGLREPGRSTRRKADAGQPARQRDLDARRVPLSVHLGSDGSEGPAESAAPPQAAKDHSTLDGHPGPR